MNILRKRSDSHIRAQSFFPPEERGTMADCPACGGSGRRAQCKWCQGRGSVTKETRVAFSRWLKILGHNRKVGKCEAKDE